MEKKKICFYHAGCADGFAAAYAVWRRYGDQYDYVPMGYGDPLPDCRGKEVLMVDWSIKREAMHDLVNQADSVTIYDHHKSAQKELGGLLREGFIDGEIVSGCAGCVLTWKAMFPGEPVPPVFERIEDRDLWSFKIEGTRAVTAAVYSYPFDFDLWSAEVVPPSRLEPLLNQGQHIIRAMDRMRSKLIDMAYVVRIGEYDVPAVNIPKELASEAGNELAIGRPFSVCYQTGGDGLYCQLWSEARDGVDVSAIAEGFGGGGHRHAAGFFVPYSHPLVGDIFGGDCPVAFVVRPGYESLARVLQEAMDQAQRGKGVERHARGEAFEQQKICEITRRVGMGYPLGQAIKKTEESLVLGGDCGVAELFGAINYLAAAVICSREGGNV